VGDDPKVSDFEMWFGGIDIIIPLCLIQTRVDINLGFQQIQGIRAGSLQKLSKHETATKSYAHY
jgi:hypothetical protein